MFNNKQKLNEPIKLDDAKKDDTPKELTKDILDEWVDRRWTMWDHAWWLLRHGIWQWLGDRPRRTRSFCQRGWRGWADSDTWNFNTYLSKVILEGLEHLREYKHGYPATIDLKTGERGYDEGRWNGILNDMIEGFTLVRRCSDGDEGNEINIGFGLTEAEKDKLNKSMQEKFPDWRLTTKEEEDKINRAFNLFKEYFWSLWD